MQFVTPPETRDCGSEASQSAFLTVPALARKYADAGFTQSSLRWQLFNREHNGFNRCVVRVGRRVLIDESEFVAWLRSQNEARAAA